MQLSVRNWFGPVVLFACLLGLTVSVAPKATAGGKETVPALLKERLNALAKIYELTAKAQKDGKAPAGAVHQARMALLSAQLDFAQNKAERIKLHEEILKQSESWEKFVQGQVKDGKANEVDILQAHIGVLEARISLEVAKQEKAPGAP